MKDSFFEKRVIKLKTTQYEGKSVIYVMSRDQRIHDNHALLLAQKLSEEKKLPLIVAFNLYPNVKNRNFKHYEFMLNGLKILQQNLNDLNIPFVVSVGKALDNYNLLEKQFDPSDMVFDFSPLRGPKKIKKVFSEQNKANVYVVDTHNIIPVWEASHKQEFAAYTIRPKILKLLDNYLVEPEKISKNNFFWKGEVSPRLYFFDNSNIQEHETLWNKIFQSCNALKIPNYSFSFRPGEQDATKKLEFFLENKFSSYGESRNNPNENSISNLSPYIHFGMISSLRIALETIKFCEENNLENSESKKSFLEELIIRKELSDNYCFYNNNYDNFNGLPDWGKETLNLHRKDKREFVYDLEQFEKAQTHDKAWNASQIQMMSEGKMHGYMRMYWAKKILEWSESPETAINVAIYLNDKYNLDGYDPNGYVGILWSIGGLHDRPWFERKIFGKIRYMNYNGLKRKFDVDSYIRKYCKINTNTPQTLC
ncbi:MAG: deoxyribodipyrimidine photo-lyase [Candidatus Dojkabacteria bacterium]|nr:MAG: deoxyribodipyrimidine photo-lyase [Candidatus Dojkabacteria bacterium]GIW58741.1 MAG: deoxyribodipyrimidine photo-lyase [Candidatus Dojkabacteria bacterium]